MFKAYVLNDVAYAAKAGGGTISGKNEVNLLAPGALAIFSDQGVLIPIAALGTTLVDVKSVFFAFGKKNGGAELSEHIPRNPAISYSAKSYVAPVAEVQFVGQDGATGSLNFPTLEAGQEYDITLADESKHGIDPSLRRKWRASGRTTSTSTAATILADVAAQFNAADSDCPVTVAIVGANVGLSFTNDNVDVKVTISRSGLFADSDLHTNGDNNAVAPVYGEGTPARVREALAFHYSEIGKNTGGLLDNYFFTYESNLNTSGTYDTYVFKWNKAPQGPVGPRDTVSNEMVIYMPNAPATFSQANFQAAMAVIWAPNSAQPSESGADTAA